MQLKSPVLAEDATGTAQGAALSRDASVDAGGAAVEGLERVYLLVLLNCCSLASAHHLVRFFFCYDIFLALQVLILFDWLKLSQRVSQQPIPHHITLQLVYSLFNDVNSNII
jgi:hypothetical protein